MSPENVASSVRTRLLTVSRKGGEEFELTLTRFAIERFLFRLSRSSYSDDFVLKGALLFELWMEKAHRATRDADLLALKVPDLELLRKAFTEICAIEVDDGVIFDPESLQIEATHESQRYPGARVILMAFLDTTRSRVQLDIGYGDAVVPPPIYQDYPPILSGMNGPRLRVYPPESVFAEKLQTIVKMGYTNSRMKDYYDLYTMINKVEWNFAALRESIRSTFSTRVYASTVGVATWSA